jgi:N-acetylglucosaminyl-diphospho-decaprenol L-rhamnosyltransferase
MYEEGIRNVVLVDNSEDGGGSIALMALSFANLKKSGMDITLLSPMSNLGFASGVSLGLEHILSNTPGHVLLINSDARLCSGALHFMQRQLDSSPIVIPMVSSDCDQKPTSSFGFYYPLVALILHRQWPCSIRHPSGCCLLIRHDAVCKDLLDQDFFFYGEDAMLGFKLAQKGVEVAECRESVIVHAGSASAKNGSIFYEYHMNRAHWLLAKKMAGTPIQYVTYIGMRCVMLPMRTVVRCFRFRSIVPLKGLAFATADVILGHCREFTPPPKN